MFVARRAYFDAAAAADEAASIADDAAVIADMAAADADIAVLSMAAEAGADIVAGGVVVVVVVVVSSFLLQAAIETAAARVTINNAVFIFLLDLGFGTMTVAIGGSLSRGDPSFKDKESKGIPVPNHRL